MTKIKQTRIGENMSGKVVIVTGGSKGIGKAIVSEFRDMGDTVYYVARNIPDKSDANYIEADVRDTSAIKGFFTDIYKKHKKIDVLVNNAGVMNDALIGMISTENIIEQFQINIFAVIELTQLVSRFMRRDKSGCIVNVASIIGISGNAGQSVYSATKGAVISFTRSAAKELAPLGIRVNAVAPGIIETPLINKVPEKAIEKRLGGICLGRAGRAEEVARAVLFLASDEASYVSGQILCVDGCTII